MLRQEPTPRNPDDTLNTDGVRVHPTAKPPGRTTVSVQTRDGQVIDLEPCDASHPYGPALTITDAQGRTATATIDSTTWATIRGFLAAEA